MALANEPSFPEPAEFREPLGEPAATDGGGGTMLGAFGEDPEYFLNELATLEPVAFEPAFVLEGGGGITLEED
jgi:hypothetical protein